PGEEKGGAALHQRCEVKAWRRQEAVSVIVLVKLVRVRARACHREERGPGGSAKCIVEMAAFLRAKLRLPLVHGILELADLGLDEVLQGLSAAAVNRRWLSFRDVAEFMNLSIDDQPGLRNFFAKGVFDLHVEAIPTLRDGEVQWSGALLPPIVHEQLAGPNRHGELCREAIAALLDGSLAHLGSGLPYFTANRRIA